MSFPTPCSRRSSGSPRDWPRSSAGPGISNRFTLLPGQAYNRSRADFAPSPDQVARIKDIYALDYAAVLPPDAP